MEQKTDIASNADSPEDYQNQVESPQKISKSAKRRKLVKSLGATGGLTLAGLTGNHWVKPTVSSVVLPAHGVSTGLRGVVIINLALSSVFDSVMGVLVEDAEANDIPKETCFLPDSFCMDINTSNGITSVTILGQTKVPDEGVVTYTNGQEFTLTISNVLYMGNPHKFVLKMKITGDVITGTISCTAPDKEPSGEVGFDGTVEFGACSTVSL